MLNEIRNKSILEILFILSFIFGTKIILAFSIFFLVLLVYRECYKDKRKSWIEVLILIKYCIYFKFIFSLIYPYGNIEDESFRMLIFIFFIEEYYNLKIRKRKLSRFSYSIFGLFLIGIVWNYFSPGGISSIDEYIYRNKILILPLLLKNYLEDKKNLEYMKYILPLAGIGFLLRYLDFNNLKYSLYLLKGGMISLFSVVLPFSIFMIIEIKSKKIKVLYSLLVILDIILIIKLGARAGLYGVIITAMIVLVLSQNIKRILFFICSTLLFLYFLIQIPNVQSHFFRYKDFSTRSREYLIRAGLYSFKNHIFFGVGSGNTQKYFIEYSENEFLQHNTLKNNREVEILKNDYLRNFPDTHNIIIDFWVQNGLYGIVFSSLLCFILPGYIIYDYIKNKKKEYLKYLGGVLGFIIVGQSWSLWSKHNVGVIYLIIIISMYWNEKRELENEKENCI